MKIPLTDIIDESRPRFRTATDFIVETLRQAILTGRLAEGTALRQDDLAEQFQLSRMPVREALRRLEADGLIAHQPHKGAVVAKMDVSDVEEIYEMRIMAECHALRSAFPMMTDQRMNKASAYLAQMDSSTDVDLVSSLNVQFHHTLYDVGNRPRLMALIASLHDSVDRYVRFLITNLDYHERSQRDHHAILDALQDRDLDRASEALKRHLANGSDEVVRFLLARKEGSIRR